MPLLLCIKRITKLLLPEYDEEIEEILKFNNISISNEYSEVRTGGKKPLPISGKLLYDSPASVPDTSAARDGSGKNKDKIKLFWCVFRFTTLTIFSESFFYIRDSKSNIIRRNI